MSKRLVLMACALCLLACGGGAAQKSEISRHRAKAAELSQKAARAYEKGDYELAVLNYREALRISRSVEDLGSMAVGAVNTAAALRALGQTDEAAKLLDELLGAGHIKLSRSVEAEARYLRALLHLDAGEPGDAITMADRALDACTTKCASEARLHNLKARAHLGEGRLVEAQEQSETGLKAARRLDERREEANALRLMAQIHEAGGDHTAAAGRYQQALKIDKTLGLPGKVYRDLMGLGRSSQGQGDTETARQYYGRARSVARAQGDEGAAREAGRALAAMENNQ